LFYLDAEPSLGRSYSYQYNGFDELAQQVDGNGVMQCYSYDSLGRLRTIARDVGDGTCKTLGPTIASWEYDGVGDNEIGRLVWSYRQANPESGGLGTKTRYVYEAQQPPGANTGRIAAVERTVPGLAEPLVISMIYEGPRLKYLDYPSPGVDPFTVRYDYDSVGNLAALVDANADDPDVDPTFWRIAEAEQGMRIKRELFGNGVETAYQYHALVNGVPTCSASGATSCLPGMLRQIRTMPNGDPSLPRLQDLTYGRDGVGNVTWRWDQRASPIKAERFRYDGLGRLIERSQTEDGQTANWTYEYSPAGNLLSATTTLPGSNPVTELYDYANHPHIVERYGNRTYAPDGNGNQVVRSGPDIPGGTQNLDYNEFNMPWRIGGGYAPPTLLEYDADEARLAKRGLTETTLYAGQIYECVGATPQDGQEFGCESHRYKVMVGGRLVAVVERDSAGELTRRFVHADHLGSSTVITDEDGNEVDRRHYDAFGAPTADFSTSIVRAGFTGHEHDSELGLINMKGRLYDPELKRFITPDPFVTAPYHPQGLNRFSYVQNNPVTYVDPSGYQCLPDDRRMGMCGPERSPAAQAERRAWEERARAQAEAEAAAAAAAAQAIQQELAAQTAAAAQAAQDEAAAQYAAQYGGQQSSAQARAEYYAAMQQAQRQATEQWLAQEHGRAVAVEGARYYQAAMSQGGRAWAGGPPGAAVSGEHVAMPSRDDVDVTFSGDTLTLFEEGRSDNIWDRGRTVSGTWTAVSGARGHTGPQHQGVPWKGPIPTGRYLVRQQDLQEQSLGQHVRGVLGKPVGLGGAWPGGLNAWGRYRVWLIPLPGTATYGRGGFSIHGGSEWGSAGCIDLTTGMPSFVRAFVAAGRDLILEVNYSKSAWR
jgi:RHS repeat-associated protein